MFVICATFFLLILAECRGQISSSYGRCANDTNDLATRVKGSSIVVFGTTMGKKLNEGSDTTFHVQFRVDCILKGPAISRMINITEAGYSMNRKYCQDFHMARGYSIAFLERRPLYENDTTVFIPADFAEMPYYDNKTDEILSEICDLQQLAPLESTSRTASVCPVVSTAVQCIRQPNTTAANPIDESLDSIQSKSGKIQVDVDARNGVYPMKINTFFIVTWLMMFFLRMN